MLLLHIVIPFLNTPTNPSPVISSGGGLGNLTTLAYTLGAALAASLGGGLMAWHRLRVLGKAEREKLEAERSNIINQAEDVATKSSLTALSAAMTDISKEREYLRRELIATRKALAERDKKIAECTARIEVLEKALR